MNTSECSEQNGQVLFKDHKHINIFSLRIGQDKLGKSSILLTTS